jgi:acyl-CoA thioester hydrolase
LDRQSTEVSARARAGCARAAAAREQRPAQRHRDRATAASTALAGLGVAVAEERRMQFRDQRAHPVKCPAMNQPIRHRGVQFSFDWPIRVYYEDTDAGGIVFFANYLKFFERARTEWLRACGIDQRQLAEQNGIVFIVSETAVQYRAPARLDDVLTIASRIERLGKASVEFVQEARRGDAMLAIGTIRVGCVDLATLRPVALPVSVSEALRRDPRAFIAGVSTANA